MLETSCPDQNSLRLLLEGNIPSPQAEELEEHLLHCEQCTALARSVSDDDELCRAMRRQQIGDVEQQQLAEAIKRGKQLRSEAETLQSEVTVIEDCHDEPPAEGKQFDPEQIDFLAPPEEPDEIGRLGGYRVLDVLGVGGMGVVFRAKDPKLKRQVALKAMKPAIAASKSAKERFLVEAQAAAAIEHDHIVTIHQVGEDRGIPFIAMRYLRGESLKTRLEREKQFDQREVVRVGRQIASGLAAAHERGLIHRDIKPDNIWLDSKQNRVKIVDFGLVRSTTDETGLTQSNMVVGTPKYMSPEQAQGAAVDHRCDLFSLGSVLYHLVTGNAPFNRPSVTATLVAVAEEDTTPVQDLAPNLHPDLARLIMRLLSKSPDERPASAGEVVQAIDAIERKLQSPADQFAETAKFPTVARADADAPAVETAQAEAVSSPPKNRKRLLLAISAVAALVIGAVIIVQSNRGGWKITTGDDIEAKISEGGRRVMLVDNQTGTSVTTTKDGETTISAKGDRNEVTVGEGGVTIKRDGEDVASAKSTRMMMSPPFRGSRGGRGWQGWPADAPPPAIAPFDAEQAKRFQEAWAKYLGAPVKIENSIGMKFRVIPPGQFLMGSSEEEIASIRAAARKRQRSRNWLELLDRETPQHTVTLTKPLGAGVHEVTRGQFQKFVEATGYKKSEPILDANQTDDYPVVNVSWHDATAFCKWLSEREGITYRLPTEAEWEYACRAGTNTRFSFGSDASLAEEYTWFDPDLKPGTNAVGRKKPNAFGLFDMHGNVMEWCQDGLDPHYPRTAVVDPMNRDVSSGTAMRGGHFNVSIEMARSAARSSSSSDARAPFLGFRIVREFEQPRFKDVLSGVYALEFDGKSSYVETPLKYDGSHPLTMEVTLLPQKPRVDAPRHADAAERFQSWASIITDAEMKGIDLGLNNDSIAWRVNDDAGFAEAIDSHTPAWGRKLRLAAVYDAGILRLFVDGRLVAEAEHSGKFLRSLYPIWIGANPVSSRNKAKREMEYPFHGVIDEVRISNVARYEQDFTPEKRFKPDEHTLALYHFDEGEGDVLKDSSGHGHHGKIIGAKWVRVDDELKVLEAEQPGDPYARDRKAAEWVLSQGGTVSVIMSTQAGSDYEGMYHIAEVERLPARDFRLLSASLSRIRNLNETYLKLLSNLPSLKYVDLFATSVSSNAIRFLLPCPRLKFLTIARTSIRTSSLPGGDRFAALYQLHLSVGQIDDDWDFLSEFSALKSLYLDGLPQDRALLQKIAEHKSLQKICLSHDANFNDEAIDRLQDLNPSLRIVIHLEGTPDSFKVVGRDAHLPTVKSLAAQGWSFSGQLLDGGGWNSERAEAWDRGAFTVTTAKLPVGQTVGPESVRSLASCIYELHIFDATNRPGANQVAQAVPEIPSIHHVWFNDTDLNDEGLRALSRTPWIDRLDVKGTQVTQAGVEEFKRLQPTCIVISDFGVYPYEHKLPRGWNVPAEKPTTYN